MQNCEHNFPHKLDSVITILFIIGKLSQVPYCFDHWRKYIIRFGKWNEQWKICYKGDHYATLFS